MPTTPLALLWRVVYWTWRKLYEGCRQPLADVKILDPEIRQSNRHDGLSICRGILSRNFTPGRGLNAGQGHFAEFWSRDAFFGCWGFLTEGKFDEVK